MRKVEKIIIFAERGFVNCISKKCQRRLLNDKSANGIRPCLLELAYRQKQSNY